VEVNPSGALRSKLQRDSVTRFIWPHGCNVIVIIASSSSRCFGDGNMSSHTARINFMTDQYLCILDLVVARVYYILLKLAAMLIEKIHSNAQVSKIQSKANGLHTSQFIRVMFCNQKIFISKNYAKPITSLNYLFASYTAQLNQSKSNPSNKIHELFKCFFLWLQQQNKN